MRVRFTARAIIALSQLLAIASFVPLLWGQVAWTFVLLFWSIMLNTASLRYGLASDSAIGANSPYVRNTIFLTSLSVIAFIVIGLLLVGTFFIFEFLHPGESLV